MGQDLGIDLPADTYLFTVMPPPAWPRYMAPGDEESADSDLDDGAAAAVLVECFSFLLDASFELAPESSWQREPFVAVPFVRADCAVIPVLVNGSDLAVLVAGPVDPATSVQAILRAGEAAAAFGRFPTAAGGADGLRRAVQQLADGFADAVGPHLASTPVDQEAVLAAARAGSDRIRHERWGAHARERADAAWREGRMRQVLRNLETLERTGSLSDVERSRLAEARASVAAEPSEASPEGGTLGEQIERRVDRLNAANRVLDDAFEHRDESATSFSRWEDAALEFREALEAAYPKHLWTNEGLRRGDADAVDEALTLLEVDPWTFHSGYLKRHLTSMLSRVSLSPSDRKRVHEICLRVVDGPDRPEFHAYSRLAKPNATQAFRRALHDRVRGAEAGVARRALWMLVDIGRTQFDAGEVDRARTLAFDRALEVGSEGPAGWVAAYTRRFWSADWGTSLVAEAAGADAVRARGALVLLGHARAPVSLAPDQADRLTHLLLQMIDGEVVGSSYEWLATWLDQPGLRHGLEERTQSADPDVRRRSTWALNAIRRHAEEGGRGL